MRLPADSGAGAAMIPALALLALLAIGATACGVLIIDQVQQARQWKIDRDSHDLTEGMVWWKE